MPTFANIFQMQEGVAEFRQQDVNRILFQNYLSEQNLQIPNLHPKTFKKVPPLGK